MRDVFWATDEHGSSRMKRRGSGVLSFPLSLIFFQWQGRHAPLTPDPSPPFRGRGEDFVFSFQFGGRGASRLCV